MNLLENVHGVWHLIGRNKMRSFLTMLGIIIGIMSVIIVMSVGAGAQSLIINQVSSLGSNLVGVLPGHSDEKGPPASVFGVVVTSLKEDDLIALMKEYPHFIAVTGYVKGTDTIVWGDQKTDTTFTGVSADLPNVEDATAMLRGIKEKYEVHHGVKIKDSAIKAAVELASRYISDRFLPDKAVDLMDEAASALRLEIENDGSGDHRK